MNTIHYTTLLMTGVLTLWSATASAQALRVETREASAPRFGAYANAGFDDSLVTLTLGGTWQPAQHGVFDRLALDVAMPMLAPTLDDRRVRLGARWQLLTVARWHLLLDTRLFWNHTENDTFTGDALGTQLTLSPSWQYRRWLLGLELSHHASWATHLRHTQAYREVFYEQARDGWYGGAATSWRGGARVARRLGERLELSLQAGYQRDGRYNILIPPLYATLGAAMTF